jgi:hypothetical protein
MADDSSKTVQERAVAKRRNLKTASRDDAGFSVEALPHLSAQQVKWLAQRASSESNVEASAAADIPLMLALEWMEQPEFLAIYQEVMENKREGFKQLATQLLPQALLALQRAISEGTNKEALEATKLLLRNQALLIDSVKTVDKDALGILLEEIRRPRPVTRILPNPKDYAPKIAPQGSSYVDGEAREIS